MYRILQNSGSKNPNGYHLIRSRLQNLSLVSEKDLKEEMFLAYLINSSLINCGPQNSFKPCVNISQLCLFPFVNLAKPLWFVAIEIATCMA